MKVVFGDLEEMLSELKEKEIREVRVEPLYDERQLKDGIAFLRAYVAVEALLPQHFYGPHEEVTTYLYACYEEVTYKALRPFRKDDMKRIFDENLKARDEMQSRLAEAGFTVRAGHFRED